jgi:tetratricopeptide (TPR) repeat protein
MWAYRGGGICGIDTAWIRAFGLMKIVFYAACTVIKESARRGTYKKYCRRTLNAKELLMKKFGNLVTLILVIWSAVSTSLYAQTTMESWYLRGNEYYEKGDYTNAISAYSQAINSEGGFVQTSRKAQANASGRLMTSTHSWTGLEINAYLMRGRAYYRIKNYDAAITDFHIVAEKGPPDFYQINVPLGDAYGAKREYDKAVSYYEKYLKLKPADEPMTFTVDKSVPADMWFCTTLWKQKLLTNDPKYEKWIKEICDKNPVTRAQIAAFYKQNRGW